MYTDKVFTPPAPDDPVMRKGLYSDVSHDPAEPAVLGKRKWPMVTLISLLVLLIAAAAAAATWSAPRRTPVEINMYAVRMTEEGKVLAEGQVILRGELLTYRSEAKPSVIETTELVLLDTELATQNVKFSALDGSFIGNVSGVNRRIQYTLTLELDPEGLWCVIRQNDLYIVCSTDRDFDPMAVLEMSALG